MKKTMRSLLLLALAVVMTIGLTGTALAADTPTDATKFTLTKNYVGTADAGSPAETFTFTITNYGVWNAGLNSDGVKITTENMPQLVGYETGKDYGWVTITAAKDAAKTAGTTTLTKEINLPTYDTVGDYWYKVVETDAKTTGVIYGSNDSATEDTETKNNAHAATYYIHVQVVQDTNAAAGNKDLKRSVTVHKTAPAGATDAAYNDANNGTVANYKEGDKVSNIENDYSAGSLVVKKLVTGNAGDKTKFFEVTVVFTKPEGTIVNSDITFSANLKKDESGTTKYPSKDITIAGQYSEATASDTLIKWTKGAGSTDEATATAVFYVKDNTTVTFNNIPYGVSYTVTETEPTNDTYTNEIKYNDTADNADAATTFNGVSMAKDEVTGEGWAQTAKGAISDPSDEIIITNTKNNTIDVGVVLSDAPYIALLLVAGAAALLLLRRRHSSVEE